ncbi:ectoine/hydroxyectoine ABC transporter permease subunit EhuC [Planosporangium flavigriseum]|uniref:Ectoine/hydroxyectoine ABC transporter permease subunit EhuC n=1 Tax=Planosporangium flavigriseum TaxID=373681 RepID=A0A8J3LXU1_9ACTN|nr:ectoine/hydroxyectoine ABC transporter permease subunit EhuC [Planosporangium flavigriseum]NJC63048.1 ectoine/hydroxyectoine ABC transporter permease subunit EhuC [Planosporangium flavigriseum]GIG73080.1 ectoine/hydroxyectoine ABC transporter permease subunit EhuC [Planosporangium flavigriseum]
MGAVVEYAPLLLRGLGITLLVTVLSSILVVVVAFVTGLARLSRHWFVHWPATVIVEIFRGTSLVIQIFWFFYALPLFGINLVPLAAAVLTLGLNGGCYAGEIVRGVIKSRPKGQTEVAIALGMGPWLRMRRVLIPQSIPAMLPPFGNVMIDLLKNTSLLSLVTIADLTFRAQWARSKTGETVAIFLTLLVIYFALSWLLGLFTKWLERRFSLSRRSVARPRRLQPVMGGE